MEPDNTIIAFDESGNTGADLSVKDQPVFILASVKLTLEQAISLKSIIKTQSDELKFNRLKKYPNYHSQIISLLNSNIISENTVKIALYHKEYCILGHTVDRLIEPVAYDCGLDIYKNGLNLTFTNLLSMHTSICCGEALFEDYKTHFINLFQKRDSSSINQFYNTVQKLIESNKNEELHTILCSILASSKIIHEILKDWDINNFDPTLPGFIQLIDYWGRKTDNKFYAHVDNSKALTHFKPLVDRVKSIYVKEQEIGTDRRTLQLPLKLIDLKFEDSKNNIVVQIADLIAGAANHYFRALAKAEFKDALALQIEKTKIVELLHNPVWPHDSISPEDLGTIYNGGENILDRLADLTSKLE